MSDSVRPQRRQPTRLLRPWDSPGKNTGVGCHFLLQCVKVKVSNFLPYSDGDYKGFLLYINPALAEGTISLSKSPGNEQSIPFLSLAPQQSYLHFSFLLFSSNLALKTPLNISNLIFHSSCEGKLRVALQSLQGQRDLIYATASQGKSPVPP